MLTERFRKSIILLAVAYFCVTVLAAVPAFAISGSADGDGVIVSQEDNRRHLKGGGGDGLPGKSEDSDPGGSVSSASSIGEVLTEFTINRRVGAQGGHDCTEDAAGALNCTASTTSCAAANDFTMNTNGDIYATPNQNRNPDSDQVTLESVTITTATGAEARNGYSCFTPGTASQASAAGAGAAAEPVVVTVTREDFARLPVQPLAAHAGPDEGWLPVSMINVLHTEPVTQALETELLGTPVQVRALPIEYHWDLGDGNTITTKKPGKPFPSEQVTATYSQEGWYDITLTTTFAGQYSVNGGEWQDIDGTIEIASDPVALFSKSLESRLVNSDVPVDEENDPWIPARSPETEGPLDPDARHRTL